MNRAAVALPVDDEDRPRPHGGVPMRAAIVEDAIEAYLQHDNENPTPFVWTATVDAVLEKVGTPPACWVKVPPGM